MNDEQMKQLLADAVAKALAGQQQPTPAPAPEKKPEEEMVSKAFVDAQFAAMKAEYEAKFAELEAKASREGVGRKGTVDNDQSFENDPVAYLMRKAKTVVPGDREKDWTAEERAVIAGVFHDLMAQGMRATESEY